MLLATRCVHSGSRPDPVTGGINTPVFGSSAFVYLDRDDPPYPRYFNTPNQRAVEEKLAALEGAEDAIVFGSGMAAISTTILGLLSSGDHVVVQDEIYGGTHAFVTKELRRWGIEYSLVGKDAAEFSAALRPNTKLVYIETPSNPLLGIVDIRAIVNAAHAAGTLVAIDNTFATPVLQSPLSLGVDVSLHSGTKYLGGHSDLCCGAAAGNKVVVDTIRRTALGFGGSLNAEDLYLLERSLKTLALRVNQQTQNAMALANHLCRSVRVRRVHYPGLPSHPGHVIANAQMRGFGAMLSFELDTDSVGMQRFVRQLRLVKPALSLGGVESTLCTPANTSHRKMAPDARLRLGIGDCLVRVSVGIEDVADIIEDIEQAIAVA